MCLWSYWQFSLWSWKWCGVSGPCVSCPFKKKMRNSGGVTSAAHRGRRQTDTCGAAKRQRASNGEWKRQTLVAAKRGQIVRSRGRLRAISKRGRAPGVRFIYRRDGKNYRQVQNGSMHSHFSQGQAEGQVTLANGSVFPLHIHRNVEGFKTCQVWFAFELVDTFGYDVFLTTWLCFDFEPREGKSRLVS